MASRASSSDRAKVGRLDLGGLAIYQIGEWLDDVQPEHAICVLPVNLACALKPTDVAGDQHAQCAARGIGFCLAVGFVGSLAFTLPLSLFGLKVCA